MPLLDINNAWAACQSAEASSDAIARRIGMASYVDDATYSSINQSSEKIRPAIALERPNGIESVTHQDDRDHAWAYAPQSYRRSSLDKATLSGTTRKARKCAYRRRRIGPSSEVHDVGGSGSRSGRCSCQCWRRPYCLKSGETGKAHCDEDAWQRVTPLQA